MPENLVILGDAICSFNPMYGQGMSMALLEVDILGKLLSKYAAKKSNRLSGLADEYQQQAAKLIQAGWNFQAGQDALYPFTVFSGIEEKQTNWIEGMINAYMGTLMGMAASDPMVRDMGFYWQFESSRVSFHLHMIVKCV